MIIFAVSLVDAPKGIEGDIHIGKNVELTFYLRLV